MYHISWQPRCSYYGMVLTLDNTMNTRNHLYLTQIPFMLSNVATQSFQLTQTGHSNSAGSIVPRFIS